MTRHRQNKGQSSTFVGLVRVEHAGRVSLPGRRSLATGCSQLIGINEARLGLRPLTAAFPIRRFAPSAADCAKKQIVRLNAQKKALACVAVCGSRTFACMVPGLVPGASAKETPSPPTKIDCTHKRTTLRLALFFFLRRLSPERIGNRAATLKNDPRARASRAVRRTYLT